MTPQPTRFTIGDGIVAITLLLVAMFLVSQTGTHEDATPSKAAPDHTRPVRKCRRCHRLHVAPEWGCIQH